MTIVSQEKILQIVNCKGWFEVSWNCRDEFLRDKLYRMSKNKLLLKVSGIKGRDIYEHPEKREWTEFHKRINGV